MGYGGMNKIWFKVKELCQEQKGMGKKLHVG
jgi:hypothetical protein